MENIQILNLLILIFVLILACVLVGMQITLLATAIVYLIYRISGCTKCTEAFTDLESQWQNDSELLQGGLGDDIDYIDRDYDKNIGNFTGNFTNNKEYTDEKSGNKYVPEPAAETEWSSFLNEQVKPMFKESGAPSDNMMSNRMKYTGIQPQLSIINRSHYNVANLQPYLEAELREQEERDWWGNDNFLDQFT